MPSLLFEQDDNLQVSTLDVKSETIKISMYNNNEGAEDAYLQINLSYDEIKLLGEWIDKSMYQLRDLQKNNVNNG